MIPRIIHYCWFGGNPKSRLVKKSIRSWKKNCKEYEIIEWNENNFCIENAPEYVKQAYNEKKWAFVTDYVRLWVLNRFGGFYLDTDVELLKPIDSLLQYAAVTGFEADDRLQTAFIGAEKGFKVFCEFEKMYYNKQFINSDGSFDITPNVFHMSELCSQYGVKMNNSFQIVEGLAVFPKDYFSPKDWQSLDLRITDNTIAIHHFDASWWTDEQRIQRRARVSESNKKKRNMRIRIALDSLIHFPNYLFKLVVGTKRYEDIKKLIKHKQL